MTTTSTLTLHATIPIEGGTITVALDAAPLPLDPLAATVLARIIDQAGALADRIDHPTGTAPQRITDDRRSRRQAGRGQSALREAEQMERAVRPVQQVVAGPHVALMERDVRFVDELGQLLGRLQAVHSSLTLSQ